MRMPDDFFPFYVLLGAAAMIEIMWTMALITRTNFLGGVGELPWLRQARRVSLVLVGFAIALEMRWHFDHGQQTWLPEYLLLSGIDCYLGTAIYSTYARLKRLGLTA